MAGGETLIKGLKVEIEVADGVSSCFVSKKNYEYSSSLEWLDAHGSIEHTNGGAPLEVEQKTINEIRTWAEKNGY